MQLDVLSDKVLRKIWTLGIFGVPQVEPNPNIRITFGESQVFMQTISARHRKNRLNIYQAPHGVTQRVGNHRSRWVATLVTRTYPIFCVCLWRGNHRSLESMMNVYIHLYLITYITMYMYIYIYTHTIKPASKTCLCSLSVIRINYNKKLLVKAP